MRQRETPKNIGFDAACQTEPIGSARKGMIHSSETEVGDDVGGIGIYCLTVAKAADADRLIAVDVSDRALSLAKQMNAAHTINSSQGDVHAAIRDSLPRGLNVIVDAAGLNSAVNLMLSLTSFVPLIYHPSRC